MILGFRFSFSGAPLAGYLLFARFVHPELLAALSLRSLPLGILSRLIGHWRKTIDISIINSKCHTPVINRRDGGRWRGRVRGNGWTLSCFSTLRFFLCSGQKSACYAPTAYIKVKSGDLKLDTQAMKQCIEFDWSRNSSFRCSPV